MTNLRRNNANVDRIRKPLLTAVKIKILLLIVRHSRRFSRLYWYQNKHWSCKFLSSVSPSPSSSSSLSSSGTEHWNCRELVETVSSHVSPVSMHSSRCTICRDRDRWFDEGMWWRDSNDSKQCNDQRWNWTSYSRWLNSRDVLEEASHRQSTISPRNKLR